MRRYFVKPYKAGSKSAKLLAVALGGKVLKLVNSKYVARDGDVVIQWGQPVGGKLEQMKLFAKANVPQPFFTTDKEEVKVALDNGSTVYARTKLYGMGGSGIVVVKPGDEIPDAKLYTAAFDTLHEYRVHVWDGTAIKVQQKRMLSKEKRLERGIAEIDKHIRNVAGGWIFAVNNIIEPSEALLGAAVDAVEAVARLYGAVDIAVNEEGNVCVFEVNTAPGLCEKTAELYAKAIKEKYE